MGQFFVRSAVVCLWIMMMGGWGSAVAQVPSPNLFRVGEFDLTQFQATDPKGYRSRPVYLDGRKLFWITAPALQESPMVDPLDERAQAIEATLVKAIATDFDPQNPQSLDISIETDEASNLPVMRLQGEWLMTVTHKDAEVQGRNTPDLWAREVRGIIQGGLIRAKLERQPSSLLRQGLLALGTIALVILLVRITQWRETMLLKQWLALKQEIQASQRSPDSPDTSSPHQVTSAFQAEAKQVSLRNLQYLQIRLLQLAQGLLYCGGGFLVLGFFPYSRWLQLVIVDLLPIPFQLLIIGVGGYVALRLSELLIDRFLITLEQERNWDRALSQRMTMRFTTIARVTKGLLSMVIFGLGLLIFLSTLGIQLAPVLAGAGIIGLAISFASQSLIKDFINGFLILLEDQYAVGDVVKVDSHAGLVENFNLRLTQLRNAEGHLITLPNSTITAVENLSKEWARANVLLKVAYGADLNQVLEVITNVADELGQDFQWQGHILNPREVIGVEHLAHDGITIVVWIRTKPLEQWSVGREFRRRLKYAFDRSGITMGIPQQQLHYPNDRLQPLPQDSSTQTNPPPAH